MSKIVINVALEDVMTDGVDSVEIVAKIDDELSVFDEKGNEEAKLSQADMVSVALLHLLRNTDGVSEMVKKLADDLGANADVSGTEKEQATTD